MKKIVCFIASLMILLPSCGQSGATAETWTEPHMSWQEQYDLGARYLSEGNYKEAIIAFTAAVEIDPRREESYMGLAEAHIAMGEFDQAVTVLRDAMDIVDDGKSVEAALIETYLKRADELIADGDPDAARDLLNEALESGWDDTRIREALSELGDGQEGVIPVNSYGGAEFTARDEYSRFEELPEVTQGAIEELGTAIIEEDIDTVKDLLTGDDPFTEFGSFYTVWGEYKVYIYCSNRDEANGEKRSRSVEMEMRPQNGTGAYLYIDFWEQAASGNKDYLFGSIYTMFISCSCEDWQWNGQMTESIAEEEYQAYKGSEAHMRSENLTTTNGTMVDSLRDGVFSSETHYTLVWTDTPQLNREENSSSTETYTGGYRIERNGEPGDHHLSGLVISVSASEAKNQWVRDRLYW